MTYSIDVTDETGNYLSDAVCEWTFWFTDDGKLAQVGVTGYDTVSEEEVLKRGVLGVGEIPNYVIEIFVEKAQTMITSTVGDTDE